MFKAKGYGAKRHIILETPKKVVKGEEPKTKVLEEPKTVDETKTVLTETVEEPVEVEDIVTDVIEEDKPKKKGRKKKAE